jgi:hypothetical protein
MPTRIEVEEVLKGLFSDLKTTISTRREVEKDIARRHPDIVSKIEEKERALVDLQDDLDDLRADLVTQDPTLSEELAAFISRESEIRNSIKQAAYTISPEDADSGLSINEGNGWRLSVSKVRTKISYKTEELLRDFPDLAEESVDGDPLIVRAVDPAILSRLCASGTIDPSDLGPYRVVTKEKNPSVRFTIGEDNE